MKAKEAVFSRGDAETQREVLDRINRNRQESTGIELSAGPPQSRLGPAPEPLPSCASLRTGKLDSCRFLSTHVDSSPHARGPSRTPSSRRAAAEPSRQESSCTRAARPFLDPSAPSRWSRWSRLSRAGPEGAAGGAREVIESAEARHASGAFLPLHLSGVSSWVASRDHRDFQDDRDGPVAQAAPESIRPLTHAAPRTAALTPALIAPGRPRAESTGIDGSRQESSCTPSRPRVDSVPPLSRCRLVPRSARANPTPVDSCRFVPSRTRPLTPLPSCPPSSRRAAPESTRPGP